MTHIDTSEPVLHAVFEWSLPEQDRDYIVRVFEHEDGRLQLVRTASWKLLDAVYRTPQQIPIDLILAARHPNDRFGREAYQLADAEAFLAGVAWVREMSGNPEWGLGYDQIQSWLPDSMQI